MVELTVTVKTVEDGTYKKKFLLETGFEFSATDPQVETCIKQTLSEIKGTPDEVKIRACVEC